MVLSVLTFAGSVNVQLAACLRPRRDLYGFTLVTEHRAPILVSPAGRAILRRVLRECRQAWPFEIIAIVLLPDHLHTLWRLPAGDCAYPRRIGWLKKEFTKAWLAAGGAEQPISASRVRHRRRGVLQRKSWEHCIRDEEDLVNHLNYIHYNPVKHGYAVCAGDWPWSSFHRYQREGLYPVDWGCTALPLDTPADGLGEPGG